MAKHRNPLPTPEEKMERKNKAKLELIHKIALAILIVIAIFAGFFTYSHFFGSPFMKNSAEKEIHLHILKNYQKYDFEEYEVKYDREVGKFYTNVISTTSPDTHFSIYFENGECYDYFDDAVTNLYNTIDRIETELSGKLKTELVKDGVIEENANVSLSVVDFMKARESGEFTLDMPVTTDLQTDFAVYIEMQGTASVKSLAEIITKVNDKIAETDLPDVTFYNATIKDGKTTAKAHNVKAEDVTEDLETKLQYALDNPFDAFGDIENENPFTVSIR